MFDLEGIRTPKMVKKVIMNLDLFKASGLDFIPVVVLKNCEPEFSYTLAELDFIHTSFSKSLLNQLQMF